MSEDLNEPILETVRLQKEYVRISDEVNRHWNDLNVRWTVIVDEWKTRNPHVSVEVKEFNEQRGVIHSIINEYSELLSRENEKKIVRLEVLNKLVRLGEIYNSKSNHEIQNAIREDIEYEMMRKRMIADRLERALDDLEHISAKFK